MTILEGTPVSSGFAMGTAVVVGVDGKPALPENLSREAIDALKRNVPPAEWQQVILAAYEASSAVGVTIPGLQVVGILAQSPTPPAELPGVPCLVGVEGLLREVEKPVIVMMEAAKGVAYVDPDVQTIIAYQSPARHRPKDKRLFIDPSHLPAVTLDGRRVEVWGYAVSVEEAARSIELGADGVFFAGEFATEDDTEAFFRSLHGLPVMFDASVAGCRSKKLLAQLETAIRCSTPGQIRFALSMDSFREESAKILKTYSAAQEELDLYEDEIDQPGFALVLAAGGEAIPEMEEIEVGTFIYQGTSGPEASHFVSSAHRVGAAAFAFGQETGEQDARMIEAGVDGIIVAAEFVAITKNLVAALPRGMLTLGEQTEPPINADDQAMSDEQ